MKKIITNSEKGTIDLGRKFTNELKGGEVVALSGDLGAGKTTLIKGIAQGLGVKKIVTSPTFILMNVYKIKDLSLKIKELVHIDCYRIQNEKDILNIGAQEYFGRNDTIVVIEWAEKIKKILPKEIIEIRIDIKSENKRRFIINPKLKA